jgi:hypothetical protein
MAAAIRIHVGSWWTFVEAILLARLRRSHVDVLIAVRGSLSALIRIISTAGYHGTGHEGEGQSA